MIGVALVSQTQLDLGAFMESARSVTGQNHVQASDRNPGISRLVNDLAVIQDFAGRELDVSLLSMSLGFLVAGMRHDLFEVMEYCSAMQYVRTTLALRDDVECILITGTLADWRDATVEACKEHPHSSVRGCFNQVYSLMVAKGLQPIFEGYRSVQQQDGTFLLLEYQP